MELVMEFVKMEILNIGSLWNSGFKGTILFVFLKDKIPDSKPAGYYVINKKKSAY